MILAVYADYLGGECFDAWALFADEDMMGTVDVGDQVG